MLSLSMAIFIRPVPAVLAIYGEKQYTNNNDNSHVGREK